MRKGSSLGALIAILALAGLGACDSIKSAVGIGDASARQQNLDAPDEFSTKRPPLTLPPDYSLRPPSSASGTSDFTASQQGRQAVFGLNQDKEANVQRKAGRTLGESALLQHAGASSVDPAIRQKVDKETTNLSNQENAFVNNLVKPAPEQAQDPSKKSDSGFLGGIFNDNNQPTMERQDTSGGVF
ncbi:MAG TPA: DUF3035 domain-containing protein [Alphaproteobacteria bacterium]|nr:DUF3035 domain-containing protein [Alphaproteobacteria bacterium]